MSNLKQQLIRLGEEQPSLRKPLRRILNALGSRTATSLRGQLDYQRLIDAKTKMKQLERTLVKMNVEIEQNLDPDRGDLQRVEDLVQAAMGVRRVLDKLVQMLDEMAFVPDRLSNQYDEKMGRLKDHMGQMNSGTVGGLAHVAGAEELLYKAHELFEEYNRIRLHR